MNPPPPEPAGYARIRRVVLSLAIGLLVGVFLHYLIYRFSLPEKPFIYSAF